MKSSVTELPFNSFLGIQDSGDSEHLLRLPSGDQYLNHFGTVHASAQLALAEATSGEFLLKHFGSTKGMVPVVRRPTEVLALFVKGVDAARRARASFTSAAIDAQATAWPLRVAKPRGRMLRSRSYKRRKKVTGRLIASASRAAFPRNPYHRRQTPLHVRFGRRP